jgi:hypothetical protein
MAINAFRHGVTETQNTVSLNSPLIGLVTLTTYGVFSLFPATKLASLAAKVSFFASTVFYGTGHPYYVQGVSPAASNYRLAGNVASLGVVVLAGSIGGPIGYGVSLIAIKIFSSLLYQI